MEDYFRVGTSKQNNVFLKSKEEYIPFKDAN